MGRVCVKEIGVVSAEIDFMLVVEDDTSFLRDWSLITGRGGGASKREGRAREVLPLRKGGAEKVLAMVKGGHKKFWGCFTW